MISDIVKQELINVDSAHAYSPSKPSDQFVVSTDDIEDECLRNDQDNQEELNVSDDESMGRKTRQCSDHPDPDRSGPDQYYTFIIYRLHFYFFAWNKDHPSQVYPTSHVFSLIP